MQDIGSAPGVTATPATRVTVGGTPRGVRSVSVRRALAWSPDGSDAGITAATGQVEWEPGVAPTRAPSPWSGGDWPPRPGVLSLVSLGWDGTPVQQMRGVIEASSGAFADGSASSRLVDTIDKLNRVVTFWPVGARMPGGESVTARPGLMSLHAADRAARRGGFYSTPQRWAGASIFNAPLQGTAYPDVGEMLTASAQSSAGAGPSWQRTSWGAAATDLTATYAPDLTAGGNGRLNTPMQWTLVVGDPGTPTASSVLRTLWGSSIITLAILADGRVVGQLTSGGTTTVVTLTPLGGARLVSLVVTPAGQWTIYTDDGRTANGTAALPAAITGTAATRVDVIANAGCTPIAGAQVAHSDVPIATNWTRSAYFDMPLVPLTCLPAVESRKVLDLLREQAAAEVGAMWIDEYGTLRWLGRDVLLNRAPVATLTSLTDLHDLAWESSLSTARSEVQVSWRSCAATVTTTPRITVWEGPGETYSTGDSSEEFIGPDADTEWLSPDFFVLSVQEPGGITGLNTGVGSLTGGVLVEDGVQDADAAVNDMTTTIQGLGPRRFLVTSTAGTLPSGKALAMKAPEYAAVSNARKGDNLPIIRARARYVFADETTTGTATGADEMPVLEHYAGPYVQTAGAAQALADWIALRVTQAEPIVTSLPVVPDLRRQLGDVVTIEDSDRSGVRLTALITSIDVQATSDPDRITQTLGVYVIDAETPWPTLADVDQAWTGSTLAQVDAAQAGDTLAEFDTQPLP